jgi:sialate O-acetylesterase
MITKPKPLFFLTALLCLTQFAMGANSLKMPDLFTDGMILQRDKPVLIWGEAEADAVIAVSIANYSETTQADANGQWRIRIPSHDAGGPYELKVQSGEALHEIEDIWYGEVWLATGQSNMVYTINYAKNNQELITHSKDTLSRFWTVPRKVQPDDSPQQGETNLGKWITMADNASGDNSAVGYFFANELREKLDVPVALIICAYGATPAETWVSKETLLESPETEALWSEYEKVLSAHSMDYWRQQNIDHDAATQAFYKAMYEWNKAGQEGTRPESPGGIKEGPYSHKSPTTLYENMLKKVMPYTARGVIWYQGESNAGQPEQYRTLFPNLIQQWRADWNEPEWPFYFVQLAAFDHGGWDWTKIRNVQTWVSVNVAHTGMAVAIDAGEKEDIHPKDKESVGYRLAQHALAKVYDFPVLAEGPEVNAVHYKTNEVIVDFDSVGEGLQTLGDTTLHGFELAASDGVFKVAAAEIISTHSVRVVASNLGDQPVAIRYAWANFPEPTVNLYNSVELPAVPFKHTED